MLKQPVEIVLKSGDIFIVESRNISSSGLQIICDSLATEEIEPRGIQSHNVSKLLIKICMDLQTGDESRKFYASCRVVSQQRLSQDQYMLNLAFVDFENGCEPVLTRFLEQFSQKKIMVSASA